MTGKIELEAYILASPFAEFYDEVPVEVEFYFNDENYWEIQNIYANGSKTTLNQLVIDNPNIEREINRKIDHYVSNYEEEYRDNEK